MTTPTYDAAFNFIAALKRAGIYEAPTIVLKTWDDGQALVDQIKREMQTQGVFESMMYAPTPLDIKGEGYEHIEVAGVRVIWPQKTVLRTK